MTIEPVMTAVVGFPPTMTVKDGQGTMEVHLVKILSVNGQDVPLYVRDLDAAKKAASTVLAKLIR